MYFKRLELFGFKSFADRTKLVFEPGVTAVVGPNGTGKSNISDAIKWVLGEQSAKELRGGKMEDVIFNGTDAAQPVNIAEVSLILSNQDRYLPIEYDEIIVTRRVFRSGESEYLLNKTQVRLKDIQDLFAGTGIGTSSYSIAEQGKMDRVLNSRPEDRREIFEEASGITKYKTKRKEALRKLEYTENNLARLADIINEVKRQINSIERQAKKAEKYKQAYDSLKELDVKHSLYQYKDIKRKKSAKDIEYQQLKEKEGSFSEESNAKTSNLRNNRQELLTLDQEISDTRKQLMGSATTIEKNTSNISLNNERTKEITSRRASLAAEVEHIEARIESLKHQISQLQRTFEELSSEKNKKDEVTRQRQERLQQLSVSIKECEAVISKSNLSIMENMAKQSRIKNEISKLSANIISLGHRHRRLSAEKEATGTEVSACADKLRQAESVLKAQLEKTQKHSEQLRQGHDKLQSLNEKLSALDESIVSFEKLLASCTSKHEILSNLNQAKEGLPEGVKSYLEIVKESSEVKGSFIGVLAEIIKVKPGYERAVETALGDELQSIILQDDEAATKAVGYLKNRQAGKASFIILDRCTQKGEILNIDNARTSKRLDNFIDSAGLHQGLISYLFDGIFFTESIEEAIAIVKDNKNRSIRVVTKDGSYVSYNKIVGGGIGHLEYTGIVGRNSRIEQLHKEAEQLKVKIERVKSQRIDLIAQIDACKNDLASQEALLREEEKKEASREIDQSNSEAEIKKLKEELSLVEMELDEVLQQEGEFKDKDALLKKELNEIEAEHQSLQQIILEKQKTIGSGTSEKETLLVSVAEVKTELSLLTDKHSSQENTLNMLKDSLNKEEFNIQNRRNQIEEGQERTESLKSETLRMVQENEILEQQKQQLNARVTDLEQKRYSMTIAFERIEEEAQEQRKQMDELRNSLSALQVNTTELNYKADSIKERTYQAYKIDIDQVNIIFDENENWQQIAQEVEGLKVRVEKMGPVNLVAIEEHKELQERYDFLTSQQQDLLDAKESLHKAINKINRTTRKLFMETFEKIKVYFKEYFRLLFGGGAADIYLIDQADILESGIEIIVRPPGKKLQSISLLSGGEKALTSIALLFALFKVKPSPFCVLDEIDAPLDEANIDRFSRMLHEFIDSTQFIIITHNKKTISIADVMYGITMEKSGISKIVSVKFTQREKIPTKGRLVGKAKDKEEAAKVEE